MYHKQAECISKNLCKFTSCQKIAKKSTEKWEAKVTTIQEAKDLSKLPLEELIGSLMTHEIIMQDHTKVRTSIRKDLLL